MRFGENNILCPKYNDIYEFRGYGRTYMINRPIFCLLLKKMEKVQEHDLDLYLNQILHHFNLIFFTRMNNKFCLKGALGGPATIF